MGVKRTLTCENCSYSVVTSAGPDVGFSMATNTFVCKTCSSLVDLIVGSKKKNSEKGIEIEEGQTCRKCNGDNFVIWDSNRKECPKCGATMTFNLGGTMICWD